MLCRTPRCLLKPRANDACPQAVTNYTNNNVNRLADKSSRAFHCLGLLCAVMVLILIVDQVIKIYVKTHFYMGEDVEVFPWMHIKFIENSGMAMGMNFIPKIALTLGRIAVVALIVTALRRLCRADGLRAGFLVTVALICAGAAGNIFDCVFYGQVFNNPMPPEVAQAFPGDGYAPWFYGRVVDMFYFPLFECTLPEWLPWVGGNDFEFFSYIFNFADASICVGVAVLILFYRRDADRALTLLFGKKNKGAKDTAARDGK